MTFLKKNHPRSYLFFCNFSILLFSFFFLPHPCLSPPSLPSSLYGFLPSHCSPVALLTPLSPNPLKGKGLDRNSIAAPQGLNQISQQSGKIVLLPLACLCPICLSLYLSLSLSPLAFISGDKGRTGSSERLACWMEECGTSSVFFPRTLISA